MTHNNDGLRKISVNFILPYTSQLGIVSNWVHILANFDYCAVNCFIKRLNLLFIKPDQSRTDTSNIK